MAATQYRRGVPEHAVRFALAGRVELWGFVRVVRGQFGVVSVRVLFYAVEDDEGEEEGGDG